MLLKQGREGNTEKKKKKLFESSLCYMQAQQPIQDEKLKVA